MWWRFVLAAVFAVSLAAPAHASPFLRSSIPRTTPFIAPAPSWRGNCPCSDPSLCAPITTPPRQEAFVFQVTNNTWQQYNWTVLTTIAMFDGLVSDMFCHAHSHGVRLVYGASFPVSQLGNTTARSEWVTSLVKQVQDTYTDGVNVDVEDPIDETSPERAQYTELIGELKSALSAAVPGSQVTVDVAWSPACIDGRCYDYLGLAQKSDFLFIMAYDEQSQIWPPRPCVANANTPLAWQQPAIEAFLNLGIAPSSLVFGIAWYGYDYTCLTPPAAGSKHCPIAAVPFRGCPCSDAAGTQLGFATLMQVLAHNATTEGRQWDDDSQTPYFHYVDQQGTTHEVWYDDVQSLTLKYELAPAMGLRGLGMWNVDYLDYATTDPYFRNFTVAMWQAYSSFFA